ncbi:MAG: ferritin-like domain-containing protein [Thermomicrobiales bacterium]
MTSNRCHVERMMQDLIDRHLSQQNSLSRRSLLRQSAVGGGTLVAISILGASGVAAQREASPVASPAMEPTFTSDVDVLNYALTLEHLETAFYRDGLAAIGARGITGLGFQEGVFDRLSEIAAHEAAHVTTLTDVITQLGGKPVAEATYDFGYTDAAGFVATAKVLEDIGVSAYNGAAPFLQQTPDLLTAALTIHAVEARHASYVALLNAAVPFPDAVNPYLTPGQVLELAGPLIVGS